MDYPKRDYHGDSYWKIPRLEISGRQASRSDYLKAYEKLLKDNVITPAAPATAASTPYEVEYKFLLPNDANQRKAFLEILEDALKTQGLATDPNSINSSKQQEDTYFDDETFALHRIGASFRLRKRSDHARITLKKRLYYPPPRS